MTGGAGVVGPDLSEVGRGVCLRADGVVKSYEDGTSALRGLSVSVASGEVLGLIGPSGSGKSTLLLCLSGILSPDEGVVLFGDRDLNAMSEPDRALLRRTSFGFVFQLGFLVDELSAMENVALPLRLSNHSRDESNDRAVAELERLAVGHLADKSPGEMSVGQAQRVAVARALVTRPAAIFADEPTGALDSVNGLRVLEALTESVKQADTALILVTHDSEVASRADRTLELIDGRIAGAP